jgi:hypothetical protein
VVPVLEYVSVALQPVQMTRIVIRNPAVQNVVVRARYDRDRVDLHIANGLDGLPGSIATSAERLRLEQTLGFEGDAPELGGGNPGCRGLSHSRILGGFDDESKAREGDCFGALSALPRFTHDPSKAATPPNFGEPNETNTGSSRAPTEPL